MIEKQVSEGDQIGRQHGRRDAKSSEGKRVI